MAICRDCIHFKVCFVARNNGDDRGDGRNLTNSPCKHFKRTTDVVEVKHGEWKIIADYKESEVAQCTNCKEEFWYMKQGQLQIKLMPYCPLCGAKMDGKDTNVRSNGGNTK